MLDGMWASSFTFHVLENPWKTYGCQIGQDIPDSIKRFLPARLVKD